MNAQRVVDLLNYIEQLELLKAKPAYTVSADYFSAFQHELAGLPGAQLNLQSEGDDVWLRLPRLQETLPPAPGEALAPWISLSRSPERVPALKADVAAPERTALHERFQAYLENEWRPWAAAEAPRRRTIHRYNQLFALQQAIASEGAETPLELVWGIGYAVWKKDGAPVPVRHPLLVQACEVRLDEASFALEVRPRETEPRLEVEAYAEWGLPGVRPLEAFWALARSGGAQRLNPFEPATFEATLKAAVGHLDPEGAYEPELDGPPLPAPGPHLLVTGSGVLFGRKRPGDVFLDDVRRLRTALQAAGELPPVIGSLVEAGDDSVRVQPEVPFRGLSSSDGAPGVRELYFPLPYNEEQLSIVRKLEANDGVVVQGPPGTGKTHTIANVICHYLAQGKRVLVTAKGESALAVVQEKLPERIRPLCVALLSDEREGLKQFEHAIQTIAARVAALDPEQARRAIAAAEQGLAQLHERIALVDAAIADAAHRQMRSYTYQGRKVTPEEMARMVQAQAAEHAWFDDESPSADGLPAEAEHIGPLREARRRVGADLVYVGHTLPPAEALPPWPELLAVHRDLVRARAIEADVQRGAFLALADSRPETVERARALAGFLAERRQLLQSLAALGLPWLDALRRRLEGMPPGDPLLRALREVCAALGRLDQERSAQVAHAAEVPADAEIDADFPAAVARLARGRGAFPGFFGKAQARSLLAAVRVAGVPARTPADWQAVQEVLDWRLAARRALARWAALAAELGLPPAPGTSLEQGVRELGPAQSAVDLAWRLDFEHERLLGARLAEVFGHAVAERLAGDAEALVGHATESLQAHLDRHRLGHAEQRLQALLALVDARSGGIGGELRDFLSGAVGRPSADEGVLQSTWRAIQAEHARLAELWPEIERIRDTCALIERAGAPKWAQRLRSTPAGELEDPALPASWRMAWKWRLALRFLDRIDSHHKLRDLFEERRMLTASLARAYQNLVAEKTWLGVHRNAPDSVRQALQAYLNAVQVMGSGTGVRALRHRKIARDAMARAYKAVPCWVLPQWRVSETVPAEPGLFDLVIVDEASQSDIGALPALLRGRKLLVVGDHQQVSPSSVGLAEERIRDLAERFLAQQPHASEMTPDKSVYDLARVVFAGNSVMLREHFRSVPPIIEFSNREFYGHRIRPLRLPGAHERLDPPLVDVFVRGGFRRGDVNLPEALAVVDEIVAILANPWLAGRTIGVVTLLGHEQAACIHKLVAERIAPQDVVARRISVGPPAVFQGRERDIMLVSMVLAPGDRAAPRRADLLQRFNVALSRARDRMVLFRSVDGHEFGEDTLNGRVIRHFARPFQREARGGEAARERCLTAFERELFDELAGRGFLVQPQVACGGHSIDLVVEGREGRRLAIECDGDGLQGADAWSEQVARQRVLERAGWTFWRCFASAFVRRRDETVADLLRTLERLGIEPGPEPAGAAEWVQHREVQASGFGDDLAEHEA